MTRFDWEPRPQPRGLVEIQRTQKREESNQKLREFTAEAASQKLRSQWEVTSQNKAEYVAQTLASSSETSGPTKGTSSSQPRPLVADELRREVEEKKAAREAEKAAAARRREVLLQQAAEMAATLEAKRNEKVNEATRKAVLNDSFEIQDYTRASQARQQAAVWNQQLEDKRQAALRSRKEDHMTSNTTSFLTTIGERDNTYAHTMKSQLERDLDGQLEEAERRKAEEDSANAAVLAQLQAQWQRENETSAKLEQEKRKDQIIFNEMADKVAIWRKEESSRRAAAAAELERTMVAAAYQQGHQDKLLEAEQREKRRQEVEAELDEWLEAKERAAAAEAIVEKKLIEQQQAEQAQRQVFPKLFSLQIVIKFTPNKGADEAARQALRRQQAKQACTINQSLLAAQSARRDSEAQEKAFQRNIIMENTANFAADAAAAQETRRAAVARFKADLGAQLSAKEIRDTMEDLTLRDSLAKARQKEEERKRYVAEAMKAFHL